MSNTSLILNGVGIVQALVKQDRTRQQLEDVTGCDRRTIKRWLDELQANGLVRTNGRHSRGGFGPRAKVYSWQTKPFERGDE